MQLRITVIALIAVSVGREATAASACSCDPTPQTQPSDEAVDVPTNLREVISESGPFGEYQLRDLSTGDLVPLGAIERDQASRIDRMAVGASLEPLTEYELTIRYHAELPAERLATFTTTSVVDLTPPEQLLAMDVRATRSRYEGVASSCGNDVLLVFGMLSNLGDAATIDVRMRRGDQFQQASLWASPYALSSLGMEYCHVQFDAEANETWELEVSARDLAGNVGPPMSVSVTVRGCPPLTAPMGYTVTDDGCPTTGPAVAHPEDDREGCASHRGGGRAVLLMSVALLAARRRRRRS